MKTALVAFDSKPFNLILSKMLNDLGFTVITTLDYNEAIELCDKEHPDVFFIDWFLNKKEIQTLLKKITFKPSLIFISKQTDKQIIAKALELGANEYIMKPFDSDILQSKLSMTGVV